MSENRPTFRDYAEHLRAVRRRTDLSDKAKLVYEALLDFAGADESCYPGQRAVAAALGKCQAKTVCAAVANLQSVGLLSIEKWTDERGRKRNRYRFPQRSRQGNVVTNGTLSLGDGERSHTGNGNVVPTTTDRDPVTEPIDRTHKKKAHEADQIEWAALVGWVGITNADRAAWAAAYPACDLDAELARMGEWLKSNPSKAHKRGWRRFLTNWLARSQERGGGQQSNRRTFNGNGQHRPAPRTNPKLQEHVNVRILNG